MKVTELIKQLDSLLDDEGRCDPDIVGIWFEQGGDAENNRMVPTECEIIEVLQDDSGTFIVLGEG